MVWQVRLQAMTWKLVPSAWWVALEEVLFQLLKQLLVMELVGLAPMPAASCLEQELPAVRSLATCLPVMAVESRYARPYQQFVLLAGERKRAVRELPWGSLACLHSEALPAEGRFPEDVQAVGRLVV